MPNQKSNKGKRNKRTNSSGDEQENGAAASAVVTAGPAAVLTGATAGPPSDNRSGEIVAVNVALNVASRVALTPEVARARSLPYVAHLLQLVSRACHHPHRNHRACSEKGNSYDIVWRSRFTRASS